MGNPKDAYYFSHDANAQDDPKCSLLIDQLGMEGYGIFWGLVERLRAQGDYKLPIAIVPGLARRWNSTTEKISTVINKFDLFVIDDGQFFSLRLMRSMEEYSNTKHRLSEAGRKGNEVRWGKIQENRLLSGSDHNPIALKESKVKESKVKEIPIEGEFLNYCKEILGDKYQSYDFSLKAKYEAWIENKWRDGHGSEIKNWKSKIKNTIPFLRPEFSAAKTQINNHMDSTPSQSPKLLKNENDIK